MPFKWLYSVYVSESTDILKADKTQRSDTVNNKSYIAGPQYYCLGRKCRPEVSHAEKHE